MTVHQDDPIDIPNENLKIVDDKTAFFFMKNKIAVTNDAGKSWNIWDAGNLPDWNFSDFGFIKDVTIKPDGRGLLKLEPLSSKKISVPQFKTENYGKNWKRIN